MNEPLNATCDNCNNITPITFKTRPHPMGIEETYFDCEHCDHHYVCYVTDYKVRAMQRRKGKMIGDSRIDDRLAAQEDINQRMAALKHEHTKGCGSSV